MTTATLRSLVALGAATLISACGNLTDLYPHAHQGCTVWYNTIWGQTVNSALNHTDPRSCPLNLVPGQPSSSGGIVYDRRAAYPNLPSDRANYLSVNIADDLAFGDHTCVLSLSYGPSTEYFFWGQPYSGSPNNLDWQAENYVSFNASYNPDYACFMVDLSGLPFGTDPPRAVITMNYFGEQGRLRRDGS